MRAIHDAMSQDGPSRSKEQFMVRLPDGMRDQIASAAEANGRSMNAEIVTRLSQTFGASPGVLVTGESITADLLIARIVQAVRP